MDTTRASAIAEEPTFATKGRIKKEITVPSMDASGTLLLSNTEVYNEYVLATKPSEDRLPGSPLLRPEAHDENDIDITWINLYAPSDFSMYRVMSDGPIEKLLIGLGKKIDSGVFEMIFNVSASKHALYITVGCSKNWSELGDQLSFR